MPDAISTVILTELREFRLAVFNKLDDHATRLATVETQLDPLMGNGQPGVIARLQDDVSDLKNSKYYLLGFLAAAEGFGHWLGRKLGI